MQRGSCGLIGAIQCLMANITHIKRVSIGSTVRKRVQPPNMARRITLKCAHWMRADRCGCRAKSRTHKGGITGEANRSERAALHFTAHFTTVPDLYHAIWQPNLTPFILRTVMSDTRRKKPPRSAEDQSHWNLLRMLQFQQRSVRCFSFKDFFV